MNQINRPLAGGRIGATLAVIAIILGAIAMLPASRAWSAQAGQARPQALQPAAEPATAVAQDDSDDADSGDVPTSQVDKYISIYAAMQKDHNLTLDQAASKQGLTVEQFRNLENKIEGDDALRERVRKALRHAANPNAKDASDD